MTLTYLADTDVCIKVLKKRNHAFITRFRQTQPNMAVSVVTAFELYAGAENYADKAHRCAVLGEFLAFMKILPLDLAATKLAGEIHGQLSRKGQRIGVYDVLNVGIALAHNLTIATNNLREFQRVPGLNIEQWA